MSAGGFALQPPADLLVGLAVVWLLLNVDVSVSRAAGWVRELRARRRAVVPVGRWAAESEMLDGYLLRIGVEPSRLDVLPVGAAERVAAVPGVAGVSGCAGGAGGPSGAFSGARGREAA